VRDFDVVWVKGDPGMEPLHSDPRFAALLTRLALSP
jgi:hypothetical protein